MLEIINEAKKNAKIKIQNTQEKPKKEKAK